MRIIKNITLQVCGSSSLLFLINRMVCFLKNLQFKGCSKLFCRIHIIHEAAVRKCSVKQLFLKTSRSGGWKLHQEHTQERAYQCIWNNYITFAQKYYTSTTMFQLCLKVWFSTTVAITWYAEAAIYTKSLVFSHSIVS